MQTKKNVEFNSYCPYALSPTRSEGFLAMDFSTSQPISKIGSSTYAGTSLDETHAVNILIVDASHAYHAPRAYKFENDSSYTDQELTSFTNEMLAMKADSFISLGFVEAVKRKSRIAILDSGLFITYCHLIVVGSGRPSDQQEDFFAALASLIEAMKLRDKLSVPVNLVAMPHLPEMLPNKEATLLTLAPRLQELFSSQLSPLSVGKLLTKSPKSSLQLYELQL